MLYLIYILLFISSCACTWLDELDPQGNVRYEKLIDNLKFITDEEIFKRDEQSQISSILDTVYDSGLISDTLYEIAIDDEQIENLAAVLSSVLAGNSTLSELGLLDGLNISIDVDQLLNQTLESGLIQSTAGGLLLDEGNRILLANLTGRFLQRNVWVGQILNNLGAGQDLTVEMLANTIQNTPNLNPRYNSSVENRQQVFSTRDFWDSVLKANEGSAQDFLNNLINGIIQSQTVSYGIDSVLAGLNESQIVVPLALDLLQNNTILSMIPKLVGQMYDRGAFDRLDLNPYYQDAKRHGILSDSIQWLLTNPKWEPPVALLLLQMEQNGVFKDIEDGLYGPN